MHQSRAAVTWTRPCLCLSLVFLTPPVSAMSLSICVCVWFIMWILPTCTPVYNQLAAYESLPLVAICHRGSYSQAQLVFGMIVMVFPVYLLLKLKLVCLLCFRIPACLPALLTHSPWLPPPATCPFPCAVTSHPISSENLSINVLHVPPNLCSALWSTFEVNLTCCRNDN